MRICLRPIIKSHDSFDDPVQLLRQLEGAGPAAVGDAARGRYFLQLNRERGIELLDRAGKNDGAAWGVLLSHDETMCRGKLAHLRQIGRIGTVLLGEFLPAHESH